MKKMPAAKKPTKQRLPLSRDRVLRAALRMADRSGVDALSMRKLADKLGVEAMSLYKHVANKAEVLDGLVDLVLGEIEVPVPGTGWRDAMRARAVSARATFLRHPWAAVLIESRMGMSDVRLRYTDAVLGLLRQDGFSAPLAYRAFLLVDSYLYGFTMQELSWPFEALERPEVAAELMSQVDRDAFPNVVEVMEHWSVAVKSSGAAGVYDAEFGFGLEHVLDCLERIRSGQPGHRS